MPDRFDAANLYISLHAAQRYREHVGDASNDDVREALRAATPIEAGIVIAACGRRLPNHKILTAYYLSADRRGIFVVEPSRGDDPRRVEPEALVTYLRMNRPQQAILVRVFDGATAAPTPAPPAAATPKDDPVAVPPVPTAPAAKPMRMHDHPLLRVPVFRLRIDASARAHVPANEARRRALTHDDPKRVKAWTETLLRYAATDATYEYTYRSESGWTMSIVARGE